MTGSFDRTVHRRAWGHRVACAALGVAAGWLAPASRAEPPPLQSREEPSYSADVLVFHEEDRLDALVWLVVHCPVTSLYFEADSSTTELRLAWKVRRGGRQVDGDVLVRRVEVARARRDEAAVLQTIPVRLAPGRYDVEIEVGHTGTTDGAAVTREVTIDEIQKERFAVSSLFLSAEAPGRFDRREGGLPGFPIVPRVVGEDVQHITLVGEIYAPGGCSERFSASYRLVDDDDRVVQQRTEDIPCEGFRTPLVLPLDTTNLVFGDYRVEVTIEYPGANDEVYREVWFSADESLLPLGPNFRRTLEVVEVIATDEEMAALRDAPPDERETLWEEFWDSRDPDPETSRNEFKEEFFDRIRYANQHFGVGTTRGWRTDRGRTLLELGHPDRIERSDRSGFGSDVRSIERWEYYDEGLTLVFVDDVGLGDYRLVEGFR